jgi:DNA-binding CsgD family transcriptional regulator
MGHSSAPPTSDRLIVRRWTAPAPLTVRELQVLEQLARGLTARQAAAESQHSVETIGYHLQHVRRKLGASNTVHAVAIAIRRGLL